MQGGDPALPFEGPWPQGAGVSLGCWFSVRCSSGEFQTQSSTHVPLSNPCGLQAERGAVPSSPATLSWCWWSPAAGPPSLWGCPASASRGASAPCSPGLLCSPRADFVPPAPRRVKVPSAPQCSWPLLWVLASFSHMCGPFSGWLLGSVSLARPPGPELSLVCLVHIRPRLGHLSCRSPVSL